MLGRLAGGKSDFTLSPVKKIMNISDPYLSYFGRTINAVKN
jgi:hypothetical protein